VKTTAERAGPPDLELVQLVHLIREQALREAAAIAADARERAGRIEAAGRAEAEAIRAAAEREGAGRGRRRAARLLALRQAECRMRSLRAREALIDEALAEVRRGLADPSTRSGGVAAMARLVREAVGALPEDARVRISCAPCPPEWAQELRAAAGAACSCLELDGAVEGGAVVETEDGRLRFDNSIPERMRRIAGELRLIATRLLLDGQDPLAGGAP
jgi:vacuolar-type H+-ATPase subunit E/Vma4